MTVSGMHAIGSDTQGKVETCNTDDGVRHGACAQETAHRTIGNGTAGKAAFRSLRPRVLVVSGFVSVKTRSAQKRPRADESVTC